MPGSRGMEDKLEISPSERKLIEAGETTDVPKYTSNVLTNAIQWSGANGRDTIGDVTQIFEEFTQENPDASFEDWREHYYRRHDGDKKLQEGASQAYDMLQEIREALEKIDQSDVREFLEHLVIYQTYRGQNIREIVVRILEEKYRPEVERMAVEDDKEYVHAKVGGELVSIQPESGALTRKDELAIEDENVVVVYYRERSDGGLVVSVDRLNNALSYFS